MPPAVAGQELAKKDGNVGEEEAVMPGEWGTVALIALVVLVILFAGGGGG